MLTSCAETHAKVKDGAGHHHRDNDVTRKMMQGKVLGLAPRSPNNYSTAEAAFFACHAAIRTEAKYGVNHTTIVNTN